MGSDRDLWSLPGPINYARSVRSSFERGFSTLCVIPAAKLDTVSWTNGFRDAVDLPVDVLEDSPDRAVSAILCEALGLPPALDRDAAKELAHANALAGRVFEVTLPPDNDRAKAWVRFVTEFVAASKSVNATDRPRFLVLSTHPSADLFTDKSLLLEEYWWWGVLSRIDTTIFVSQVVGADTDPLIIESIVEIIGYDLDTAQDLAGEWDGSLETLLGLIPPVEIADDQADPVQYASRGPRGAPARDLRNAWDVGALDSWDRYQAFRSPRALSVARHEYLLKSRLWRAQLRELMPFIDEERQRLEEWVRGVPKESEPEYPMEVGKLASIIKWDPIVKRESTPQRREAAEWLRIARNTLAHRGTLSPDEVFKGRRLLDNDRRANR